MNHIIVCIESYYHHYFLLVQYMLIKSHLLLNQVLNNDKQKMKLTSQFVFACTEEYNFSSCSITDANQIRIDNLKPNTEYKLKVKAKNEVGTGSPYEITAKTETIREFMYILVSTFGWSFILQFCVGNIG